MAFATFCYLIMITESPGGLVQTQCFVDISQL